MSDLAAWIDGAPVAELGDGAEEQIRRMARRQAYVLHELITALQRSCSECYDRHDDQIALGHVKARGYALGYGHGLLQAAQTFQLLHDWACATIEGRDED